MPLDLSIADKRSLLQGLGGPLTEIRDATGDSRDSTAAMVTLLGDIKTILAAMAADIAALNSTTVPAVTASVESFDLRTSGYLATIDSATSNLKANAAHDGIIATVA